MENEPIVADEVTSSAHAEPPTFASEAPVANARLTQAGAKRDALSSREADLSSREGELALAREKGLAGPRAELQATIEQRLPDSPMMQPTPEPEDKPIIDHEHLQKFGTIAFPFVLLLGAAMRADGTQALNALSSSVQGYMQGRQQESQRQFAVFQEKFKKVVADNKQKLDEYRNLLQRRDIDMQQKIQLLQIAGQKYDDAAMYHATERKSIADIYKQLDVQDRATAKIAEAEVKISKTYEDNATRFEVARLRHEDAQQRIKQMGTNRSGGAEAKKVQWLHAQQINIYKTFAGKMAALTAKQQFLTPGAFKMAEQQLRTEFATAMRMTNNMGRAEGFQIQPDMEALEHPEHDPFGPSSTPNSEQENHSFLDAIANGWNHMFGGAPGSNPSRPQQGPTNNDGGWSAVPK